MSFGVEFNNSGFIDKRKISSFQVSYYGEFGECNFRVDINENHVAKSSCSDFEIETNSTSVLLIKRPESKVRTVVLKSNQNDRIEFDLGILKADMLLWIIASLGAFLLLLIGLAIFKFCRMDKIDEKVDHSEGEYMLPSASAFALPYIVANPLPASTLPHIWRSGSVMLR